MANNRLSGPGCGPWVALALVLGIGSCMKMYNSAKTAALAPPAAPKQDAAIPLPCSDEEGNRYVRVPLRNVHVETPSGACPSAWVVRPVGAARFGFETPDSAVDVQLESGGHVRTDWATYWPTSEGQIPADTQGIRFRKNGKGGDKLKVLIYNIR